MTALADRVENGDEEAFVDAVAALVQCDGCGFMGDKCICTGGPYASPGAMMRAVLDFGALARGFEGSNT